jgi:hypothetical protein
MDNTAGLNDATNLDIIMGVLYGITALVLMFTAYVLFTKRFRRQKLEVVNSLKFTTSRYNVYSENGQFLLDVPTTMDVKLELLNEDESLNEVLIEKEFEEGEHIYKFDISKYETGFYYLKLSSSDIDLLRKIKINR